MIPENYRAACLPLIGLLCFTHSSCKEKPAAAAAPPPPAADSLAASDVPVLKISPGQEWKYRVTIENPKHPETGKPASASFERVRRFMGPIDPGNGHAPTDCFEVSAEGAKTIREFVKITPEEVALVGQATVDSAGVQGELIWFSEPIAFFKAGLIAGDSLPLTVLNKEKNLWRVIRVIGREKVRAGEKEYEAVRLQMLGKDDAIVLRRTYWFTPGEGIVLEEKVREVDGKPVFSETDELIETKR